MSRKKQIKRNRPARRGASRRSDKAGRGEADVKADAIKNPLNALEILSRVALVGSVYFALFRLSHSNVDSLASRFLHIAIVIYLIVCILLVVRIAFSARRSASTLGVWWVYFWITHNSIVLSAFLYLMIGNSQSAGIHLASKADGLSMLQGLYLSLTTFTTIGYGDIVVESHEARLLVVTQGAAAFVLTLVLALVLARSTIMFLQEDKYAKQIRERVGRLKGHPALHRGDRVLGFASVVPWGLVYRQTQRPVVAHLSIWHWILIGLGLAMPFLYVVRIIRATRDPLSAPYRVKYLFVSALAMVFAAYPGIYWMVSRSYGSFTSSSGSTNLSMTDSFALSVGNMVAHSYAGVAPANDLGRGLIMVQQIATFALIAVVLAFVNARWEPETEVQRAWVAERKAVRKSMIENGWRPSLLRRFQRR